MSAQTRPTRPRTASQLIGVLFSMAFLAVAVGSLTSLQWAFRTFGPDNSGHWNTGPWLMAVVVGGIGLFLLLSALPRRHRSVDQTRPGS